jgi:hypothetical protein
LKVNMTTITPIKRVPAGTFREPKAPEPQLAERVRRGQAALEALTEKTRKSETLSQEDYEVRINARD